MIRLYGIHLGKERIIDPFVLLRLSRQLRIGSEGGLRKPKGEDHD